MKIITAATISTASLLLATVGASSSAQDLASASASSSAESPEGQEQRSPPPPPLLTGQDWTSQLSCTGDFSSRQPSINDEPTCDATSGCVWCDGVKGLVGQGICASEGQKEMLGQFWDQLCGGQSGPPATPPTPPVPVPAATANPTSKPTDPPVAPAPAPAPDNPLPDAFKCEIDESQNVVTDRTSCEARKDPTSSSNCVWCDMYGIGGTCFTNDDRSKVSFLCKNGGLRAGGGGDWRSYDPSCLGGADGIVSDWRECATRKDKGGGACAWCDAAGVFGVCVSAAEQTFLDGKLTCDTLDAVAVE